MLTLQMNVWKQLVWVLVVKSIVCVFYWSLYCSLLINKSLLLILSSFQFSMFLTRPVYFKSCQVIVLNILNNREVLVITCFPRTIISWESNLRVPFRFGLQNALYNLHFVPYMYLNLELMQQYCCWVYSVSHNIWHFADLEIYIYILIGNYWQCIFILFHRHIMHFTTKYKNVSIATLVQA